MLTILQFASYILTFLGAGLILVMVRPAQNYWPGMKILAAMIFGIMGQVLTTAVLVPWYPTLKYDTAPVVTRAIFMVACTYWTLWLVVRRNRIPPNVQIGVLGKLTPITTEELAVHEEAVQRSIEQHGHEDNDNGLAYDAEQILRHARVASTIAEERKLESNKKP